MQGVVKNSELSKYAMLLFLSMYSPRLETSQISTYTNIFRVTVHTITKGEKYPKCPSVWTEDD